MPAFYILLSDYTRVRIPVGESRRIISSNIRFRYRQRTERKLYYIVGSRGAGHGWKNGDAATGSGTMGAKTFYATPVFMGERRLKKLAKQIYFLAHIPLEDRNFF